MLYDQTNGRRIDPGYSLIGRMKVWPSGEALRRRSVPFRRLDAAIASRSAR
jgi:hypothetical protein